MANFTKTFLFTASALGFASLFAGSAQAASITGATLTGDAILYDYSASSTDGTPTTSGFTEQDLINSLSNTNNIELDGQLGDSGAGNYAGGPATTLEVDFDDGTSIIFSSLTSGDWDAIYQDWFIGAWSDASSGFAAAIQSEIPMATNPFAAMLFASFSGYDEQLKARFSDPNLFSVSKDGDDVTFSLAGHLEGVGGIKMSEVIKYSINGGETWNYEYAFGDADSASGVVDDDEVGSHDGLYTFNVSLPGGETESVPEPATVLGLLAVGSVVATRKRK